MRKAQWLVFGMLVGCTVWATDSPLLVRKSTSFIVRPFSTETSCFVYADKVLIVHKTGDIETTETKPLQIRGDLAAKIENAAGETRPDSQTNYAMQTGSTEDGAYRANGDGVLLYKSGPGRTQTNTRDSAAMLRGVLNAHCR